MATMSPAENPHPDDDNYNESEDEDFDPAADAGEVSDASSDSDGEAPAETAAARKGAKGKRKRPKKNDEEAEDVGFENSGDEAIVKRGTKRRKKQGGKDGDDSGGEGGFVKTRRMRAEAAEEQARKPLATTEGATIDVGALWAEMNDPDAQMLTGPPPAAPEAYDKREEVAAVTIDTGATKHGVEEDMIEIEESYMFAAEVHTSKKLVPRSSAEGQKWLKQHPEQPSTPADEVQNESSVTAKAKRHPDTGEPLLRPLRRISLWDPNPSGTVKGLPANILGDSNAANKLRVVDKSKLGWHTDDHNAKASKAKKLNVLDKTAIDWKAHVAETGDKEDLEKAAKAKGNFLERRDFLERVEARKDQEERRVRVK